MRPRPDTSDFMSPPRLSVLGLVLAFVSAAGMTGCIALLYEGMAWIMEVSGGFVASGGPYAITHPAPNWAALLPLSMVGLLAFWGVSSAAASRRWGLSSGMLMWSLLFVALGWNFLRLGLRPPARMLDSWAWTLCGAVFWIMGFAPALLLIPLVRKWFERLLISQTEDANRFWKIPRLSDTSTPYLVAQALGAIVGPAAGIVLFAAIVR